MEKLLSPVQVAEIMSISKSSAYVLMNRIPHIQQPLRVTERALREYIESKMIYPIQPRRKRA